MMNINDEFKKNNIPKESTLSLSKHEGDGSLLTAEDFRKIFQFYEILSNTQSDFPNVTLNALSELFHIRLASYAIFEKSKSGASFPTEIYGHFSERQMKKYRKLYYLYDPFYQNMANLRSTIGNRGIYTSSIFGDALFQSSDYGRFLKDDNIGYQALLGGGYLSNEKDHTKWPRHILCVYKQLDDEPFTPKEVELYSYIGQTFSHCVHQYKHRHFNRHLSSALDLFLNNQEYGYAILDANGKILKYNTKFMDLGLLLNEESHSLTIKNIAENVLALMNIDLSSTQTTPSPRSTKKHGIRITAQRSYLEIEDAVYFFTFLTMVKQDLPQTEKSTEKWIVQYGLTMREAEIADLAAHRFSNDQIHEKLYISQSTVKSHLQSIYSKMGISSRAELIALYNQMK